MCFDRRAWSQIDADLLIVPIVRTDFGLDIGDSSALLLSITAAGSLSYEASGPHGHSPASSGIEG